MLSKYRRLISLVLVIFTGMGFRLLQFEGAIVVYFLLLCLFNFDLLWVIKPRLLLICFLMSILLTIIYLFKDAHVPYFMFIVIFGCYVFLLPYVKQPNLLGNDIISFSKFSMYYTLSSIPLILIIPSYLTETLLDYSLYKTFLYTHWFSPVGGLGIFDGLRFTGITWEPGIWQLFLNFNLLFAFYEKRSTTHIILSLLSIIVVYSTTGLIVASILLAFSLTSRFHKISKAHIVGTILTILVFLPYIYSNFESKLYGEHMGSGMTRFSDFFTGVYLLFQNPIFGSTPENAIASINPDLVAIKAFFWSGNFIDGSFNGYLTVTNSNGYILLLLDWGLPIGLILLVLSTKSSLFKDKKINFIFYALLFISMSSEAISNTTFFYSLIILGLYNYQIKIKLQ